MATQLTVHGAPGLEEDRAEGGRVLFFCAKLTEEGKEKLKGQGQVKPLNPHVQRRGPSGASDRNTETGSDD